MSNLETKPMAKTSLLRRFFGSLGPGLITGAADDDPSGVATYSVIGAQSGTQFLFIAPLTWPLMAAVQVMCARIGMVTDQGLAGALRLKFPKGVLVALSVALLMANTINIGADLVAMADATDVLFGVNSHIAIFVFGLGITLATVKLRYHQIARVLKWLALFLVAYIITAFLVKPNWSEVFQQTIMPKIDFQDTTIWATLVAVLGTTISPYLFFWQASQEVEEHEAKSRRLLIREEEPVTQDFSWRVIDCSIGTFISNLVMFFIILTTALTLHTHGITNIETSKQAAEALQPLAGHFAFALYTAGIIGVGLLAIPTLSGSAAYAFAETFKWKQGLDKGWRDATAFYAIIIGSTILGSAMDFLNINPIKGLFWSAVINGVLAPFLLVGILLVARDKVLMKGRGSSMFSQVLVGITAVMMFAAMIGMFVF